MTTIDYSFTRDQFTHFTTMPTRWRDMDSRQHINHAAYLTYLETSRIDFSATLFGEETEFIMGTLTVEYHQQLKHPATLQIGHKIVKIGNKSFKILSAIFREDESDPVVTGLATLVSFDYESQKTLSVPEVIRKRLNE
ncbi:MAG: hypothetical protein CMG71_07250 [Candidatus Marinimicrobia bacterium]|nr:hypothetical protein [Candidatus Neomarinimicrobiota bacterium]|tara:strand:+ start:2223 stop:2636 length:414 start_codon:yes stop_codon:yes gene_type:complete